MTLALALSPAGLSAEERVVTAQHAMVVSVSKPATLVGVETLKHGGNAVDAAVATAFALAVTYPEAGNIGGGGFMLICPAEGAPTCIDYRETAPAAATPRMFEQDRSRLGCKIVGAPGTVRGLALAHARRGKLPWSDVVAPAARLAAEGFTIDAALAKSLNEVLAKPAPTREFHRVFAHAGGPWKEGDRLTQPELAATLRLIGSAGPDAFYTGPIAEKLVAEMKAGDGLITLKDLAIYEAKVRDPVHGTFRGYDLYAPPPPSSGGVALVEMLNILETFDLKKLGRWSPEANHLILEAMRRAYCDRARHLGDADFVEIPAHLTSKEYARQLAATIDRQHATPSDTLAKEIELSGDAPHTTHFSIIDSAGMAVSNTYTLEQAYGSRVVVRGAGFLLNNEMGDFNPRPGHTDRQGLIGTPANVIAPGKRMLSSMTPLIVTRNGRIVLVTGSPGGRTIINTVLSVTLNVLEFDMDLRGAVDAPRWHHAWFPDRARFEGSKDPKFADLVAGLRKLGHTIVESEEAQGDAHSILVLDGQYIGVADERIRGSAAGY
jgi:gamma-glutamyltranspeptidase/glutathione hydrolase